MKSSKEYILEVSYKGFNYDYDDKIISVVGRQEDGAGFGFDQRDISFTFYRKSAADKALKRVRKQCRRMNTKVELLIHCPKCGELLKSKEACSCLEEE